MYKDIIKIKIKDDELGERLDKILANHMPDYTRSYIHQLFEEQLIVIKNYNKKIKPSTKLKKSVEITVNIPEDKELDIRAQDISIDIVYEDQDMVIINKAPDMVVHPAPGNYEGTLVNAVMYHIKDLSSINGVIRPGIVHRLDKDTSGLIIIAKNDQSHLKLVDMFKDKTIEKTYLAIINGIPRNKTGRIENLIGRNPKDRKKMAIVEKNGKTAISNYEILSSKDNYSLVRVKIETGRTHQIRVHMKSIGHVIVGDQVYGNSSKLAKRQMLHAYNLKFNHPITGLKLDITGPLPVDFSNLLNGLGLEFKS